MKTLRILAREHAAIAALSARLAAEVDAAATAGAVDGEAIDRLLQFFEARVDGQHQEKEERALLPRLRARAAQGGAHVVEALAADHALQRRLLAQMRAQLEGAAYAEPNSLAVLVRCARSYLRAQGEHSRWEQAALFPLAARLFGPDDDEALLRAFRLLDRSWGGLLWDEARRVEAWLDQRHAPLPA
jgi:hemerythrin-like domain-containing protein